MQHDSGVGGAAARRWEAAYISASAGQDSIRWARGDGRGHGGGDLQAVPVFE